MKSRIFVYGLLAGLTLLAAQRVAEACHDGSPLILDLNGDGIRTVDENHAVSFDINADGIPERINWTFWESEEGFLVLDRNGNGTIDDGGELFGDATPMPLGEHAENGFEALALYDQPGFGGNGDGVITRADVIWKQLRIWIDRNQDGVSQQREISPLARFGVVGLSLDFAESDDLDGNGNRHRLQGSYLRKMTDNGPVELQEFQMHDVFFKILHDHD